jgi:hypothetical protein
MWIKCTDSKGRPMMVNLDTIVRMVPYKEEGTLFYVGGAPGGKGRWPASLWRSPCINLSMKSALR